MGPATSFSHVIGPKGATYVGRLVCGPLTCRVTVQAFWTDHTLHDSIFPAAELAGVHPSNYLADLTKEVYGRHMAALAAQRQEA